MEAHAQQPALDKTKCLNCGALFPITETLHHQLAEQAREELKNEAVEQQMESTQDEAGNRHAQVQTERLTKPSQSLVRELSGGVW